MLVIDLSATVSGRFCAKLLGMTGADVVRVPGSADDHFLAAYLDAHSRPAIEPTETLIESADVVITSFDRGEYDGDWDDPTVRGLNPQVVHVTTSTFGTTGPYREFRGSPLVDWAAGGYLFITGEPDREPLSGPQHLCGYVAGYTAAIGVEAALVGRARTGVGVHLDVSTMEAMLGVHQSTFSRWGAGILRTRTGRFTEVASLVVRPCRDGYVSLGLNTDDEFDRFAVAVERPELVADARFADRSARAEHRDALESALDAALATWAVDDVVDHLQAHRIPAAKVASVQELLADPQLAARDFWATAEVGGNNVRMPGNPIAARWTEPSPNRAIETDAAEAAPQLPLEGLVVLDFTVYWAGPSATRVLADLGARVIRIERPGSRIDAPADSTDVMVLVQEVFFHHKMNRNKESIAIDLQTEAGRDIARQLMERADVVVENFRPGVMQRFGLDADAAREHNPSIVFVSLYGFGGTGPRAWWGSYGPTLEAASSIEARTGYRGGEPLRLGHTLPDGVGGLAGALAALRGLRERVTTGCGATFDLSQLEVYCALSGEEVVESAMLGRDRERSGNESSTVLAQGVFRCKRDDDMGDDEWVAVTLVDDRDGERARTVMGVPGTESAALAEFASTRTKSDAALELQAAGISAFPVVSAPDLVTDPHLGARGSFIDFPYRGTTVKLPSSPLHAAPPIVRNSGMAPRIGEHGRVILRDMLGLDDAHVDALIASNAIGVQPDPS